MDESGKHVWRMRKWTLSVYKLCIGNRRTQAFCIHVELVRIEAMKWDTVYEARVEALMTPPARQSRRGQPWVAPLRKVAEE